jgi:hypothetical protein
MNENIMTQRGVFKMTRSVNVTLFGKEEHAQVIADKLNRDPEDNWDYHVVMHGCCFAIQVNDEHNDRIGLL